MPRGGFDARAALQWTWQSLRGKIVLIDFMGVFVHGLQRAIPHVIDWYNRYHDAGFVVIGARAPEYAFERVPQCGRGAAALHITYPVALDNDRTPRGTTTKTSIGRPNT